ncbi:unnamed protein product [Camellia sinensis]
MNNTLLSRSLENQLIPCYNFLKSVLFLNQNVIKMLKSRPRVLLFNVEKVLAPNIATLREAGVPQSVISFMMYRSPSTLYQESLKFKEGVNKAIEMVFNPQRSTFAHAVQVLCDMHELTFEQKKEVYGRWGLSNDEILLAFRSHPLCMNLSEEKIMETMDFLVNKMGWQATVVARCPVVLFFNMERRIIPRCTVVKILLTKELVKKDLRLTTFLIPKEEVIFIEGKWVLWNQDQDLRYEKMLAAAHASYDPNKTVIHVDPTKEEELEFWEENNGEIATMAKNNFVSDKVVALIYQKFTCSPPVTDPKSLEALLSKKD